VDCHRKGEAAPMTLTSYQEACPWAKAIKRAVLQHAMPPWLADPYFGAFKNARGVPQKDVETLSAWADGGAPEGNPKDTPALPHFETGWNIGKPDVVIDIGKDYDVPAQGVVAYQYFTVPTNFTEDKWIEAAEVRTDQRAAIHHVIVFVQHAGAQPGQRREVGSLLVGYAPGEQPLQFEPGTKLVKAGSKLLFQLHYTPNGKAVKDRTYVGIRFAKEPPKVRAITANALARDFAIPPGDGNYPVKSTWTAKQDVTLLGLMPHMHLRGNGLQNTRWCIQMARKRSSSTRRSTISTGSSNTRSNRHSHCPRAHASTASRTSTIHPTTNTTPTPAKEVKWGDQTWEEMMIGWFTYSVPNVPAAATAAPAAGN